MTVIYVATNRQNVRQAVIDTVRAVTGMASTGEQIMLAQGVHTSIGVAALSDIKEDFIRKSRGQVGEDGQKWPPLSQEYLAYQRRFGSKEKAALKKAAGLNRGNRHRGLLSAAQDKRWQMIFATTFKRLAPSMGESAAKARAGQAAWAQLKREGAKTMLEVFGNRVVDILRDTGVLFNSISVGQVSADGSYNAASPDQIFELTANGVIIGTKVPYARRHNRGTHKMPKRQFLPVDGAPEAWLNRWAKVGRDSLEYAITWSIQNLGRAA